MKLRSPPSGFSSGRELLQGTLGINCGLGPFRVYSHGESTSWAGQVPVLRVGLHRSSLVYNPLEISP